MKTKRWKGLTIFIEIDNRYSGFFIIKQKKFIVITLGFIAIHIHKIEIKEVIEFYNGLLKKG